jgi:hypothetical protein
MKKTVGASLLTTVMHHHRALGGQKADGDDALVQ